MEKYSSTPPGLLC